MLEDIEDDEQARRKIMLFGRDVNSIPCFRQTMLTSISSGMIAGFAYFMFTSRTRRAVYVGYGTFFCVTFGFWVYCRCNYAFQKQQMQQMQAAARNVAFVEGTERESNTKLDG